MLNGSDYRPRPSVGVVIDAEKDVVFVSKATDPHTLCDISITIADSIIVEGEVLFSHPLRRYVLIKYEPPTCYSSSSEREMKSGTLWSMVLP
jgi:hypothetical protein